MKVHADNVQALSDWLEDEDFTLRSDYSGRGMYGSKCVAIVGDSAWSLNNVLRDALADAVTEDDDTYRDFIATLVRREPESDSMGLSSVWYWPGVQAV